ncbi:MAG: inositol-3-phosphate synthase, partial [Alphaproteobacteria bacterium]|nr:inositol-3-phosphate synthase [Alphaproteobacteria bacterium]
MKNGLRVGIVGVGNCASSLVQGVSYYQNTPDDAEVPGLMHTKLGGYRVRDIEFSCAFDISANKVGRPLAEAIDAEPNNTLFFAPAPANDVVVARGPTLDGLGHYLRDMVKESNAAPVDVAATLRKSGTDVVV